MPDSQANCVLSPRLKARTLLEEPPGLWTIGPVHRVQAFSGSGAGSNGDAPGVGAEGGPPTDRPRARALTAHATEGLR